MKQNKYVNELKLTECIIHRVLQSERHQTCDSNSVKS